MNLLYQNALNIYEVCHGESVEFVTENTYNSKSRSLSTC